MQLFSRPLRSCLSFNYFKFKGMNQFFTNFFIRPCDRNKPSASLYFRIQSSAPRTDWLFSTFLKINPAVGLNPDTDPILLSTLHFLDRKILRLKQCRGSNRTDFKDAVGKALDYRLSLLQTKYTSSFRIRRTRKSKSISGSILEYLKRFVSEISIGIRLNGMKEYAASTCSTWRSFYKLFSEFDNKGTLRWHDLGIPLFNDFLLYLKKKKYVSSTIVKYIGKFKAIINQAFRKGEHDMLREKEAIGKIPLPPVSPTNAIYLTTEEIEAMQRLPLTGDKAKVRDLFVVGCHICQRVSDYRRLTHDCFGVTSHGTPVIRLRQQKTGIEVVIPMLSPVVGEICRGYGYDLPNISTSQINRHLKEIGRELAESIPSLKVRVSIREGKYKERWECITSHTARRSGITNLYLDGRLDIFQIMHISGHRSHRSFQKYIRLSSEEIADRIAEDMRPT